MKRPDDADDLGLDLSDDEWSMVDEQRLAEVRAMKARGETPTTVWGHQMTYGMYSLSRDGLLLRLAYVGGVGDVPKSMILGINSWSDDDIRAWLTKWTIDMKADRLPDPRQDRKPGEN